MPRDGRNLENAIDLVDDLTDSGLDVNSNADVTSHVTNDRHLHTNQAVPTPSGRHPRLFDLSDLPETTTSSHRSNSSRECRRRDRLTGRDNRRRNRPRPAGDDNGQADNTQRQLVNEWIDDLPHRPAQQAQPLIGVNQDEAPHLRGDFVPPLHDLGMGDALLNEAFWGEYLANEQDLLGPAFDDEEQLYPHPNDLWGSPQTPPQRRYREAVDDALGIPHFNPARTVPKVEADIREERCGEMTRTTTPDEATNAADQTQEDACLAKILEVFPDICRDHVREIYQRRRAEHFQFSSVRAGRQTYDPSMELIEQIADTSYPKQKDTKRKRQLSISSSQEEQEKWYPGGDIARGSTYYDPARRVLQEEFPNVPSTFIKKQLVERKSLFAAYENIAEAEDNFNTLPRSRLYDRLKNPRKPKVPKSDVTHGWADYDVGDLSVELTRELEAARAARRKIEVKQQAVKDAEAAEELNEKEHIASGDMMECQCCFSDVPINRTVHCNGDQFHFFCYSCLQSHAANEIGKMRGILKCMDGSICLAMFLPSQLSLCINQKTLTALERLQQEEEIRQAGFDDLAECPFCDYKAIYPPINVDREFRCSNPECEKISCRLCNEETHIPFTCEEASKDRVLPARHQIEEAMTEALVRECPKCKTKIVKEAGCNKMTCSRCLAIMCYICRKDISVEQYNHFQKAGATCQVYDQNTEKLHTDEVAAAEKKALEKAKLENPALTEEELKVKMNIPEIRTPQQGGYQIGGYQVGGYAAALRAQAQQHALVPPPAAQAFGYGAGGPIQQHMHQRLHQHVIPYPAGNGFLNPNPAMMNADFGANGFNPLAVEYPPPVPMDDAFVHAPQAPAQRGRFPVVPFVPGRFGDVVHNPPLGPMWDARWPQPHGPNVPPAQNANQQQGGPLRNLMGFNVGGQGDVPMPDAPAPQLHNRDITLRRSATERTPRRRGRQEFM